MSLVLFGLCSSGALLAACSGAQPAPEVPTTQEEPSSSEAPEVEPESVAEEPSARDTQLALARGGRLFDKWWVEGKIDFSPDSKKTPEADGKGGPFSDGTLPGADGKALLNSGHDYRLKNFFGWDLRGAEGIYGEKYQNKSYVLSVNLLTDETGRDEWVTRLTNGYEGLPAYGKVLDEEQIGLIADFIVAMRDHKIPGPDAVWALSEEAPKNYTLLEGGNAERGHALIQDKCSGCHGEKGTQFYIDDKYSLGMYGRLKAYEAWIKVLSGQPGTKMGPGLDADADVESQAMMLKDMFAAFCDRNLYPKGEASGDDAADGDARCGSLLK